jgi:hypothetical protein
MTVYDEIGRTYARTRQADPRIAAQTLAGLGDAASILNVGAGSGNYEPTDRRVIALEPSMTMIRQRPVSDRRLFPRGLGTRLRASGPDGGHGE